MTDKINITTADCEIACNRVRDYTNYAKMDSIARLRAAWKELINISGVEDNPEYEMDTEKWKGLFRDSPNPEFDATFYEIKDLVNQDGDCIRIFGKLINKDK